MSWRKPLPIKTYTDLSIYFYGDNNCTSANLVKFIDKNLECVNKNIDECCKSELKTLYNRTFRLDTCVKHNNTNMFFKCSEGFYREMIEVFLIYMLIIFLICIIFEICRIKLKNYYKKKRERELLLVSTNNTEYGTYKYSDF